MIEAILDQADEDIARRLQNRPPGAQAAQGESDPGHRAEDESDEYFRI